MASTAAWYEDNGAATGSPAQGATRGAAPNGDFKSVDDVATPRASARIIAGQHSYHKYRFVRFTGTFNEISAGKFAHTAGALGAGLTIVGKVSSTYATPARSVLDGTTDISAVTAIDSGFTVLFSTTGPQAASPTANLTAAGYTQYIVTQLQTQPSAAAGNIGDKTMSFQWNEN